MIGPSISKTRVLPKTYTPRRRRTARWARPPATSEVLERALATRAAQRALLRWRIPTTLHEWNVPTVRSPVYRERPLAHWTTEAVHQFWDQESIYRPQLAVARNESQLAAQRARQAEMATGLRRTLTALEPKTATYNLSALHVAYSHRTPRIVSQFGWQSDIQSSIVAVPRRAVPSQWEAVMGDYMVVTGITHYLCYCAPPRVLAANSRSGLHIAPRELRIIPVDALLLALYCARLPPIPDSEPAIESLRKEEPKDSDSEDGTYIMRLPTLFITVPDPLSMPILLQYLETQNSFLLLFNILGVGPPSGIRAGATYWSAYIATTCSPTYIAERMRWWLGIQKNILALGVQDLHLWQHLRNIWSIIMSARSLQLRDWHNVGNMLRLNASRIRDIRIVHDYGVPTPRTTIFSYPLEKSEAWNHYFEGVQPTKWVTLKRQTS